MRNYEEFKNTVQALSKPEDFNRNEHKLKDIQFLSYNTFVRFLQMGAEIEPAIEASNRIFKKSIKTKISEEELVELSSFFRMIHGFIDEHIY
jgi:hypothetical protein